LERKFGEFLERKKLGKKEKFAKLPGKEKNCEILKSDEKLRSFLE
jgi:hypothetical protein